MKEKEYPYSSELQKPAGSINCDRRNPIIAWREHQSIKRAGREVSEYQPPKDICLNKIIYPSFDSAQITCYVVERKEDEGKETPCMCYYHGGGFMLPLQKMMLNNAVYYARNTGVRVFLPEYRYVPKVPCTTVIKDCLWLVRYLERHKKELNIDMKRLILYGDSAGGALAASVTHLMRDYGMDAAALQMLIYPATDCYSTRYPSVEQYKYALWPKSSNDYMWKLYLKGARAEVIKTAAPLNREDFTDLPSAYVEPQEIDILRDEGIAYAKKLEAAGCLLELNVIKGSYHGFDCDHESALVKRVLAHRCEIIRNVSMKQKGDDCYDGKDEKI